MENIASVRTQRETTVLVFEILHVHAEFGPDLTENTVSNSSIVV
jgi:hypothetical protein